MMVLLQSAHSCHKSDEYLLFSQLRNSPTGQTNIFVFTGARRHFPDISGVKEYPKVEHEAQHVT